MNQISNKNHQNAPKESGSPSSIGIYQKRGCGLLHRGKPHTGVEWSVITKRILNSGIKSYVFNPAWVSKYWPSELTISNFTNKAQDGSRLITPIIVEGEVLTEFQSYLKELSKNPVTLSSTVTAALTGATKGAVFTGTPHGAAVGAAKSTAQEIVIKTTLGQLFAASGLGNVNDIVVLGSYDGDGYPSGINTFTKHKTQTILDSYEGTLADRTNILSNLIAIGVKI